MGHQPENIASDSFLAAALSNGLLSNQQAEAARQHANEFDMSVVRAVKALSMMDPAEVDAAQLLSRPDDFARGYRLVGLIGSGASGNVFRAKQIAMQRDIALKTIKSDAPATFQSRIQREAEAIARLKHPNIVVAHESGVSDGRFYIAMEFVEGGTLFDFIKQEAPVSDMVTWRIIRQIAAALSHANDAGIIHRDVKPSNVLLATPPAGWELPAKIPFIKVADFGLARDLHRDLGSRITATGVALGTPAYVAPEQLDDTEVDCRADIFALGATAFHLLSGRMPCAEQSPMKAILQKSIGE